jgi:GxxExxY protein
VSFPGEAKGWNRLDFILEDKIILEIKVVPSFSKDIYQQCMRYLVSSDKELLLLVNFYYKTTVIKRILNPNKLSPQSYP